jgi:hypothetical protein
MTRVICFIVLLCALGTAGGLQATSAQDTGEKPSTRWAGTVTNLFETLDPGSPIDGMRLQLPDEWTVQDARLHQYGTKPVPIQHQAQTDDTILLTTEAPIEGPHELLVRVRTGNRPGTYQWHLTPFVQLLPDVDSLSQRRALTADRMTREVDVQPPPRPDGPNRAVDLDEAAAPLQLRVPPALAPGRDASFTVEFWIQTNDLDQVILSSWTGDENTAYPLEFVVDQSGHLRFYCGRSGRHQALRSNKPVANSHWHHAAVVYDHAESRLHLMLDGAIADSAQARALPPVSGELPLAIGGRRTAPTENASKKQLFTGRLDETQIRTGARSEAPLRQLKDRPLDDRKTTDGTDPLHLSFDKEAETDRLDWPEGARRVSTRLTFQSPLQSLQAHTDGQSVTLRWKAKSAGNGRFLVERSGDGASFTVVDRLSPLEVGAQSGQLQEISYTDENVPGNVVFYRVRQVAPNIDTERTTGTIKVGLGADTSASRSTELIGNFPNPFKESSTIAYRVKESQHVTLTVWDLSGKRIATLADGVHEPGYYEQSLTAEGLPSGPYFARLKTTQGIQSHRMVLLK